MLLPGNSELEFMEYVWLFLKYEQDMTSVFDNLKNTFQLMDEDGNGYVTTEEIKYAFCNSFCNLFFFGQK